MAAASEVNENIQPIWQMVSLADYALPTAPTRETAVKGVTALWRLIRGNDPKQVSPEKAEDLTSPFLQIEKPVTVIVSEKPWGTHYRLKAYPIDLLQQFHFITDLTLRGKAALTRLGIEFAMVPAVPKETGKSI
jgi:hypothetical protein